MGKDKEHTEDCGPNGCSSYCKSEKELCCEHHGDEHIGEVEFTTEQRVIVEALYDDLLVAIEKTRKDGALDISMIVMPFAAVLANMFALVEQQGGESSDYTIIAFAKLLKHNADTQRTSYNGSIGHA